MLICWRRISPNIAPEEPPVCITNRTQCWPVQKVSGLGMRRHIISRELFVLPIDITPPGEPNDRQYNLQFIPHQIKWPGTDIQHFRNPGWISDTISFFIMLWHELFCKAVMIYAVIGIRPSWLYVYFWPSPNYSLKGIFTIGKSNHTCMWSHLALTHIT